MFKFSTNTILNNFASGAYHEAVADAAKKELNIHRLGKFSKDNVTKIFKREGTNGTPGSAVLACVTSNVPSKGTTSTAAGIYRLMLYVKLSGNNSADYANTGVFKGKPYAFEFEVKEAAKTAADVAKAAKAAIDRQNARFAETKEFKAEVSGANLTITAIGPDAAYHNITTCVLQKFDATVDSALVGGEYVDIAEGTLTPCVNPFGNFTQLIKDLRLPTVENTSWTAINGDDKPVIGTVYNQYMIYMCVNRGIMGGDAVGEVVKSVTAHSIWVPSTLATTFEGLLTTASLPTPVAYNDGYATALGDADDPSDDAKDFSATKELDVTVTE